MSARYDLSYQLRLLRARALRRSFRATTPIFDTLRSSFSTSVYDAEALILKAQNETGLRDFFTPPPKEALSALLSSIRANNTLNTIGRTALRVDVLRLLSNHLRLVELFRQNPNLARKPIFSPVFIMGLPRTASTFLHSMLILDPRHRAPTIAEVTYPYFALTSPRGSNMRMRRALHWLDVLEPDFQNAYPSHPKSPQECSEILSNTMESLRFDSTYDVPEYLAWMDQRTHTGAYEFHRRFLQSLDHVSSGEKRWVLKCPDHVFYYQDLLRVYPDARIIVTHRDPGRVLPSVASLTMILQGLFSDRVEPARVAQRVLDRWILGAQRVIEIADSEHARSQRVLHVFYDELVRFPLPMLEKIYRFLETPFHGTTASKVREHLERSEVGSYRANRYSEQFQKLLPAAFVREHFRDYLARFDLREGEK